MGMSGWKKLLTSRKELFALLKVAKKENLRIIFLTTELDSQEEMTELAAKHGLTLIESKTNTISLAMTLQQQVMNDPQNWIIYQN